MTRAVPKAGNPMSQGMLMAIDDTLTSGLLGPAALAVKLTMDTVLILVHSSHPIFLMIPYAGHCSSSIAYMVTGMTCLHHG